MSEFENRLLLLRHDELRERVKAAKQFGKDDLNAGQLVRVMNQTLEHPDDSVRAELITSLAQQRAKAKPVVNNFINALFLHLKAVEKGALARKSLESHT